MELSTFAQVQAARLAMGQAQVAEPITESQSTLSYAKQVNTVDGIRYQRCGGGRRVIRKKIGGS